MEEVDDEARASEEVKALKQKVADLKYEIKTLDDQKLRLTAQNGLLGKYSDGLFSAGQEASTADLLDVNTIGKIL